MVAPFPGSIHHRQGRRHGERQAGHRRWLAKRWRVTAGLWCLVLVGVIAGLAVINAAGVYAQLVAAHIGSRSTATIETHGQMGVRRRMPAGAVPARMSGHEIRDERRQKSEFGSTRRTCRP